jgi:two-component system, OmpR family, phosphate regulon sensor histidine kinase PhoR
MRPRGSIIGQLLATFCVCAVLIGIAAVAGFVTVTDQNAATRQATDRYTALQRANSQLETAFGTATFAALFYAETSQRSYLAQVTTARAEFGQNLAALRRGATPDVRGLIGEQARLGAQWFALAPRAAAARPGTPAAVALLGRSARLGTAFARAAAATQQRLNASIDGLAAASRDRLEGRLAWSGAALVVAVLLVLAASLSTVYTITRPMRRITATVRRLTAGDHSARVLVTGSAEVRQVAESINTQADESDRLRAAEAESNRLRAMAREAGLRIREHLVARDVQHAAKLAVEQIVDADVAYLRLLEDDHIGSVVGQAPRWLIPADVIRAHLPPKAIDGLRALFRAQTSQVINDLAHGDTGDMPPQLRQMLLEAGVRTQLITPFGVGGELLGLIVLQRMQAGRPWTAAEVDAMESVAADLGRGLNHARLYEAENRLVEDLKALDTAKSSFFATVSHELRAPLTTIEGYVEMFGDGEAGEVTSQQRQMLEAIDRSTVRLRNLVDDVFTLAKLESGAFTAVMRPVDLTDVIRAAADAVRPSVIAGELALTISATEGELMVDGDASQLDRVVINLLSNAVKFTPKGGCIEVSAFADGRSAVVRVRDTGIGIPASDQKELFNRFFRASNATGRSIPGTGLGLAIVRMIVVNHGGDIDLRSTEGAGTTVTVWLPLLPRAQS